MEMENEEMEEESEKNVEQKESSNDEGMKNG